MERKKLGEQPLPSLDLSVISLLVEFAQKLRKARCNYDRRTATRVENVFRFNDISLLFRIPSFIFVENAL